jgi:hypothetical protein
MTRALRTQTPADLEQELQFLRARRETVALAIRALEDYHCLSLQRQETYPAAEPDEQGPQFVRVMHSL